jgi:hypothetical protein
VKGCDQAAVILGDDPPKTTVFLKLIHFHRSVPKPRAIMFAPFLTRHGLRGSDRGKTNAGGVSALKLTYAQ